MEMQMELSYVFAVVITGLVVVFLGLILLIACINIIGKIFTAINNRKKSSETVTSADTKAVSISESVSENTDDDEVIAVISVAVAMMSAADNTTYRVKSIKAVNSSASPRNAWAMAGLKETTNPF